MKKIAVISAFNQKPNPGMITSDLAFDCLKNKYFNKEDIIVRYNIEEKFKLEGTNCLDYEYLYSPEEQLKDYDYIFFWGDFLHSRYYHSSLIPRLDRKGHLKPLNHIYKTLLLENCTDDIIKKVFCIGSTLVTYETEDYFNERYRNALCNLYTNCALVMPREPLSLSYINMYNKNNNNTNVGTDCAFFLEPRFTSYDRIINESSIKNIGFFIGRANQKEYSIYKLRLFFGLLAKRINAEKVININWFMKNTNKPTNETMKMISEIRNCSLIITDTYHCAINAWREGVPAICIGWGADKNQTTVNEKKKELLYTALGLNDYYVYYEHIMSLSKLHQMTKKIGEMVFDKNHYKYRIGHINHFIDDISNRLSQHF